MFVEQRKELVLHKSVRNNFRRQDNVDIVVGQILGIVTVIYSNEMNKYKWSWLDLAALSVIQPFPTESNVAWGC